MNILFASQAIDGHFNPMTGVAMRLKERGHDVRCTPARCSRES